MALWAAANIEDLVCGILVAPARPKRGIALSKQERSVGVNDGVEKGENDIRGSTEHRNLPQIN